MSAPNDTYATDIADVVHKLVDRLNKEHKTLANSLAGQFVTFHLEICAELRPVHASKAAAAGTPQTMPRLSFTKLLTTLKEHPHAKKPSLIIDGVYRLRHFTIHPDLPDSLFYDDKAVIAHDAIIHVLRAIWEHAPITEMVFKELVCGTCAYIPPHIVSRFLCLVRRRTSQPISKAEKAVIIRQSTFGHTIVGESYVHVKPPHLTPAAPDSAGKGRSLASPEGDQPSSLASRHSSISQGDVRRDEPQQLNTGKRKSESWFPQVTFLKRRRVDNGEATSASVADEEPAALPGHVGMGTASGAGAAQGTAPRRPVRPKRRGCLLWPVRS